VAIGVFVLALPVAAHQIWDYLELRRLVAEVQAIIDRGEPVTEHDAGFEYEPWSSGTGEPYAGSVYVAAALLSLHEGSDPYRLLYQVHDRLQGAEHVPPDLDGNLVSSIPRASGILVLADEGAGLAFRGFAPGTSFNYRAAGIADLSALVAARTVALSLDGDGDGAVRSAMSALGVRRATEETGFPSNGGHETSAILSWSRPSPEMLVRLQTALEAGDEPGRELRSLIRKRADVIDEVWRRYYGTNPSAPGAYSLPGRSMRESLVRPVFSRRFAAALRLWADLIAAAREPFSRHAKELQEVERRHDVDRDETYEPSSLRLGPLSYFVMKAMVVAEFERQMRPNRRIEDRAALAAVAVARYQRDHGDALTVALDELVPDYLDEVPSDPLSDGPLRYRHDARSYVIYSVGPDGTDDGGALVRETAPGNIRRFAAGPDIGVRVLIGEQRDGSN
jgi:hypothetical protein